MRALLKTAALLAVGAATLATGSAAAGPAFAATATVPVRVVPGMPKVVDACGSGGFTVTGAPRLGTVVAGAAGFTYTSDAGVTGGEDRISGHCDSRPAVETTFRVVIEGRNPEPVRIRFAETCEGRSGTVVFTVVDNDTRRHRVEITSPGLAPTADGGPVPAASTITLDFGIGADGARVGVRVDGGRPAFVELTGCPAANGATGVVPGHGTRTGGGFLDRKPRPVTPDGAATAHPAVLTTYATRVSPGGHGTGTHPRRGHGKHGVHGKHATHHSILAPGSLPGHVPAPAHPAAPVVHAAPDLPHGMPMLRSRPLTGR